MDYFYLGSSLPKIGTQDLTAEKDVESIKYHIYSQLEDTDKQQFVYLLFKNDNKNFLHLLRKREGITEETFFHFYKPSFYSYQELEEGMSKGKNLPGYMKQFLKKFPSGYEGGKEENTLVQLYLQEAIDNCGNFLSDYFQFKKNLKNIISALNARKFGYSLQDCLIGNDMVVETIQKSNSNDLGLGKTYPFIEEISEEIEQGNFLGLEKKIDKILLSYLDSHTPLSPFSEDAIFLYFIKLMMGSRWIPLEKDNGKEKLQSTLDWIVSSANLPEEHTRESSA